MYIILDLVLHHGCSILLLAIDCPAKFSSNSNQTPVFNFQTIMKTLISCLMCVWLELAMNFAGQWLPGAGMGTLVPHLFTNLLPIK